MKYSCNPINIEYKYQFIDEKGNLCINREAADPSIVMFKGKYFLFPSMTAGFFTSDNLTDWEYHSLKDIPIYDYAPDVRVIDEYLYFSASKRNSICSYYRTKDPISGIFEELKGTIPFWDPNLFVDDDGKIYFYWGCSNIAPIYGVELNSEDFTPKGEPMELIFGREEEVGYERVGDNHIPPKTQEEIETVVQSFASRIPNVDENHLNMLRRYMGNAPYIEGAWMDKHNGKYYLQYACPGTEYNIYADGVYISDNPLGPFSLANNNPLSYKPGGFITGAGHGSTMEDKYGNLWHTSTMRICVNHQFERRLGIWQAGYDKDGELFCNQRYGDWPIEIEQAIMNPWKNPEWMLLSYGKPAKASSFEEGKDALKATDENVQTWWKAASNKPGEWIEIDLKQPCYVHAIQVNFADDKMNVDLPKGITLQGEITAVSSTQRYIDENKHFTRWILEGSEDGKNYFIIADKSQVETDLSHDLVINEAGIKVRYLRCTVKELPFNQNPCISGLRVFGLGVGELPKKVEGVTLEKIGELDLLINWESSDVVGYNVLWGYAPDKLYHSYMVLGSNRVNIGALIKGKPLFVRVDAFNEKGITEGDLFKAID